MTPTQNCTKGLVFGLIRRLIGRDCTKKYQSLEQVFTSLATVHGISSMFASQW